MTAKASHQPLCAAAGAGSLDDGTMVRGLSPVPGMTGGHAAFADGGMLSSARRDAEIEQLARRLHAIQLSSGKPAFDSYAAAKDASKLLKPFVDTFGKSAEATLAWRTKQPAKAVEKGVEAFGALSNATHYGIKLSAPQSREWETAAKLFQQSAKTVGFLKAMKMASPQGQAVAVGVLATEKILLQAGIATKSQGLKCATSLATLAADGVGLVALGSATGGMGAAFFAVSFAWSVADATYQCAQLLEPPPAALPPFSGYFTMLKYLVNQSPEALEKRLGYHPGRLASGYRIIVLAGGQSLGADDFELVGSTRWSDGVLKPADGAASAVKVGAALEDRLGAGRLQELRAQVASYFAKDAGNAPAKVIPNLVDQDGSMHYPAGDALYDQPPEQYQQAGVPQFRMARHVQKPAALHSSWKP